MAVCQESKFTPSAVSSRLWVDSNGPRFRGRTRDTKLSTIFPTPSENTLLNSAVSSTATALAVARSVTAKDTFSFLAGAAPHSMAVRHWRTSLPVTPAEDFPSPHTRLWEHLLFDTFT